MSAVMTKPAITLPKPWRLTHAEYHRLGDLGFFHGKRVELIHGEVIEMSPMGQPHQVGILLADGVMRVVFSAGVQHRIQLPLRLGTSEPEPDIAIAVCDPRDVVTPAAVRLVVEISEATLDYDLSTKAELYAQSGIADYWVIDLDARLLHVLRDPRPIVAGGHRYYNVTIYKPADTVAPLAAPDMQIRVVDLLP